MISPKTNRILWYIAQVGAALACAALSLCRLCNLHSCLSGLCHLKQSSLDNWWINCHSAFLLIVQATPGNKLQQTVSICKPLMVPLPYQCSNCTWHKLKIPRNVPRQCRINCKTALRIYFFTAIHLFIFATRAAHLFQAKRASDISTCYSCVHNWNCYTFISICASVILAQGNANLTHSSLGLWALDHHPTFFCCSIVAVWQILSLPKYTSSKAENFHSSRTYILEILWYLCIAFILLAPVAFEPSSVKASCPGFASCHQNFSNSISHHLQEFQKIAFASQ